MSGEHFSVDGTLIQAWAGQKRRKRHSLVANARAPHANGQAERATATAILRDAAAGAPERGITVGADKGYDTADFVGACLAMKVTSHVAQNTAGRASAVPATIAATENYTISQRAREIWLLGLNGRDASALCAIRCDGKNRQTRRMGADLTAEVLEL